MGSPVRIDVKRVTQEKSYKCKICDMGFSSGRVLGGHVRSHMAAARLAAQDKNSPILGEKLESDGGVVEGAHEHCGYGLRENPTKSWKFSVSEQGNVCSSSRQNRCSVCEKVFRSERALFGHMRHHSRKERRRGRRNHSMPSLDLESKAFEPTDFVKLETLSHEYVNSSKGVRVSSGEVKATSSRSSLEEVLSDYERVCPTRRKKRSIRMRCNGNLPRNSEGSSDIDLPLPTLLSDGVHQDEIEAAMCLLMMSRGVRNWEWSYGVNESLKESSSFFRIENESEGFDGLHLGVGNKRRRLCEADDAVLKMQNVSGRISSFSSYSNVEGKVIEHEISLHMISQGVEVQSRRKGDIVEEIKSLVEDALEGKKVAELGGHDELEGESGKKLLSEPYCGNNEISSEEKGYKCKNCGKTFPTHQGLGGHSAKFGNRRSCCAALNSEKSGDKTVNGELPSSPHPAYKVDHMVSFDEPGLKEQNHKCPTCGKAFSSGQALGGHKRSHYNKESAAVVSKRNCDGTAMLDLNVPLEVI